MMRLRSARKKLGDIKSLDVILQKIYRANIKHNTFYAENPDLRGGN